MFNKFVFKKKKLHTYRILGKKEISIIFYKYITIMIIIFIIYFNSCVRISTKNL